MDADIKKEFEELKRKYEALKKSQGRLYEDLDHLAKLLRSLVDNLRDVHVYGLENEERKKIAKERMIGHAA